MHPINLLLKLNTGGDVPAAAFNLTTITNRRSCGRGTRLPKGLPHVHP